ncbi:MAG: type II toxin-antitoxin system RelE/ParE family toxin, partial [Methanoregula sp.]
LSDRARKEYGKLPPLIAQRILDKLFSISDDPFRTAERCEGYPFYHHRIGRYRAILEIDETALSIRVLKIDLRKSVYDR